jgi:hypothetical protein
VSKKFIFIPILFLFLIFSKQAGSAITKIAATAPGYAQNTIELYTLHDFVTEEKVKLGILKFNAAGLGIVEFDIQETTACFADFDGYLGTIYLEPGKSYEILFPPKRTLTESQKRNPFTKPEPVWFGVLNSKETELNFRIQQFEQVYLEYENKYFNQIFAGKSKIAVDTVKKILDKEFPITNDVFFESHKLFRKANLDFALNQGKSDDFLKSYFNTIKPKFQLLAYSTIFNQYFLNYFTSLANSTQHPELGNIINSADLNKLNDFLQNKFQFNQELSHWIILKSLQDAYYSKQFSKSSILKLFDQVVTENWSAYEQKTARLIRNKLTWLASGTAPPALNLKDIKGSKVSLTDFPNTYIYLHFTDPKNTICMQHLDALKIVAAHYKEKLVIINVIPDLSGFTNSKQWSGIFTSTTKTNLESYKVKTFPNSFLIGKDGKLLLSPAPNPIDGLDRQLGQIFKSDYLNKMRNNSSGNPK